jgi:hypothetical protein
MPSRSYSQIRLPSWEGSGLLLDRVERASSMTTGVFVVGREATYHVPSSA